MIATRPIPPTTPPTMAPTLTLLVALVGGGIAVWDCAGVVGVDVEGEVDGDVVVPDVVDDGIWDMMPQDV